MAKYNQLKCKVCENTFCELRWLPWRSRYYCSEAHMLQREQVPKTEITELNQFFDKRYPKRLRSPGDNFHEIRLKLKK